MCTQASSLDDVSRRVQWAGEEWAGEGAHPHLYGEAVIALKVRFLTPHKSQAAAALVAPAELAALVRNAMHPTCEEAQAKRLRLGLAAAQGDAGAQSLLGVMHHAGEGGPKTLPRRGGCMGSL